MQRNAIDVAASCQWWCAVASVANLLHVYFFNDLWIKWFAQSAIREKCALSLSKGNPFTLNWRDCFFVNLQSFYMALFGIVVYGVLK